MTTDDLLANAHESFCAVCKHGVTRTVTGRIPALPVGVIEKKSNSNSATSKKGKYSRRKKKKVLTQQKHQPSSKMLIYGNDSSS